MCLFITAVVPRSALCSGFDAVVARHRLAFSTRLERIDAAVAEAMAPLDEALDQIDRLLDAGEDRSR